jgi:ATP-binding cassette subfamily B (MDR/TAP) protein 1
MMMGEGFGMIEAPSKNLTLARQAAHKIFAIINRVPAIDSFSETGLKPTSVTGTIEVRDVVFSYPSSPDTLVCKNYSLSIPAGATVALCGPSGSGKSTLVQLLERFYDPHQGSIALDGHDLKALNVRWLRSQLGYVGQEPVLFSGTVAQNIGYGKVGTATQQEIEEAAKMANAHGFITEVLNNGYSTEVGAGGSKLSGGQKQRVAIARAMIKQPKVLLLDEATSALDTKSERIVQAALDEIMTKQKRTTVVIAHRLSTIRNADKIAVLREGSVVEEGTYDSLMTINDGLFRSLAEKQEALLAADKAAAGTGGGTGSAEEEVVEDTPIVVEAEVVDKAADKKAKKEKAKKDKGPKEPSPFPRVYGMVVDQFPAMIVMFGAAFVASALSAYAFYLLAVVMEVAFEPLPDKMRERALDLSVQMLVYAAIIIGCFGLTGLMNGLSASVLTARLRARGLASVFRQEMGFFDEEANSAAELTAFLAEKTARVKVLTSETIDFTAQLLGGFGGFFYVVIRYCPWQLIVAWLVFIGFMCLVMPLQMAFMTGEDKQEELKKKGKEDNSKIGKATNSANKIVGDAVTGIRTVASFNLEHKFLEEYTNTSMTVANVQKKDACAAGFGLGSTMLFMFGGMGVLFWYSFTLLNDGIVDMKQFMAPLFVMTALMVPMMKGSILADIPTANNAAARLFKLFDRVPAIDNLSDAGATLPSVTGAIEVRDVVFAYPTAPETLVCKNYSLSIPAGSTLALCGPSGSGKSTIILLLERFYDPQSGSITLDGTEIKSLSVRYLRSLLGYVGQEPVLFQGSVAQNIAYGKGGTATQKEIEEAAKMANAHGFITETLGEGYKTDVGLKGGKLSGGQKQRVAIARAMIRQPKVLLLDEATSALDNESERIVQAALDEIMTKMKSTTIVIAHRLSTIRNADKIAVVNEGSIKETGTHDELLAQNGMYVNLVMSS